MLHTNPPSDRLLALMQGLLGDYARKQVPPSAPARGIVEEQDALDAVMNLAAILDKNLRDGALPRSEAAHMAAMLMILREHVRPLPQALVTRGGEEVDGVGADLREFVDGLRTARNQTGMRG